MGFQGLLVRVVRIGVAFLTAVMSLTAPSAHPNHEIGEVKYLRTWKVMPLKLQPRLASTAAYPKRFKP